MQDEIRDGVPVLSVRPMGVAPRRRGSRRPMAFDVLDQVRLPRGHRAGIAKAVASARRLARLDHPGFAEALRDRLLRAGESAATVTDEAVAGWEQGRGAPSALSLLAAADVAGVELEVLFDRPLVVERLDQLERQVTSQAAQVDVLQRRLRHA